MSRSQVSKLLSGGRRQKVIVEYHDIDCGGPEWWVMLHTGRVEVVDTASAALKVIQRAAAVGNKTVTVTIIEWRNTPDGFKPPSAEVAHA